MGGRHHQKLDTCEMNGDVRFIMITSNSLSLQKKQRSLVI